MSRAFNARLEGLGLLRDGWMDGEGISPSTTGLVWLAKWTEKWPEDIPLPYVYPTLTGGILLEWSMPSLTISINVELTKKIAEMLVSRTEDGAVLEEINLDLSDADGWQNLAVALRRYANSH